MTWAVCAVVLGFSLPEGRRLAHDHPPPPPSHPLPPHSPPSSPPYNECDYPSGGKSCDGDPQTAACDVQDEDGDWTRSCDMHHTTSCDGTRDCKWPPPPPLMPARPAARRRPRRPRNLDWLPLPFSWWRSARAGPLRLRGVRIRRRGTASRTGASGAGGTTGAAGHRVLPRVLRDTVDGEHRRRARLDADWHCAKCRRGRGREAPLADALRRAVQDQRVGTRSGQGLQGSAAKRDFRGGEGGRR